MVRAELKRALAAEHPELAVDDVERILKAFFDAITAHLSRGGRVEIRGFGSFATRERDACTRRDPRNGEPVDVGATRTLRFKAGKELREIIKGCTA